MKLTPWFPGDVKPVHVGVYERRLRFTTDVFYSSSVFYSQWDGEKWCALCDTVDEAASLTGYSSYQNFPWRGVKK